MASLAVMNPSDPHRRFCAALARLGAETSLAAGVQAIVLTGSIARGEGSWLRQGRAWRLLGDADVLLVPHDDRRLPGAADVGRWKARVESDAEAEGMTVTVSLNVVRMQHLRMLPPHIFGYELQCSGRVVWGAPDVLKTSRPQFPDLIPHVDGWRLLANRMVELLPHLERGGRPLTSPEEAYPWVKLYLDMATSYLIFVHNYQPSYAARVRCLRECARRMTEMHEERDLITPALVERVAACTAWKLSPGGIPAPLAQRDGRRQAIADAEALWRWELARLTGAPSGLTRAELWSRWLACQRGRDRWRGWASALRHGGRGSWRRWLHWAALAGVASPRHLVYEAAAELFFTGDYDPSRLPIPAPGADARGDGISGNFHRFVANTLA